MVRRSYDPGDQSVFCFRPRYFPGNFYESPVMTEIAIRGHDFESLQQGKQVVPSGKSSAIPESQAKKNGPKAVFFRKDDQAALRAASGAVMRIR